MPRTRRAGADTGRYAVLLRDVLVVDPVDAKRAFLHHARRQIHLTRAIGTGPGAEAAADAVAFVHQNDAVIGPLVAGAGRADGDAGRVLAMQARFREMHDLRRGVGLLHLEGVDAVQERPDRIRAVRVGVRQRLAIAARVPFLAGDHAGVAADAGVEVDDEAEFDIAAFGKSGHCAPSIWKLSTERNQESFSSTLAR